MMSICQRYGCNCHRNGCASGYSSDYSSNYSNGYSSGCSYYPYSEWTQPICYNPTHYCCAGSENGPTLVINKIVLESGGEQSCTPRSYSLRITGPSYPHGEVFTLRAGSCVELDEPLIIAGLIPGQYTVEELYTCHGTQTSTLTGPVCGNVVNVSDTGAPTVITIVSRRHSGRCCGCHHNWRNNCCW